LEASFMTDLVSLEDRAIIVTGAARRCGCSRNKCPNSGEPVSEADLRGRASHGLLRLPRVILRIRNGVAMPCDS
jgi:LDH2 family malate/lactate/ureidoglycolate dehydrogenase